MKNYSFFKGLQKAVISIIIVGGPLAATLLPTEWANLTLSGAILLLVNFLKVKYGK